MPLNVHHNSFYHLIHQNSDHEWLTVFFIIFYLCNMCVCVYIACVCLWGHVCHVTCTCRSEGNFLEFAFPYTKQIQGLNSSPQVCVKCLYLLNHLTSLNPFVLISPDLRKIGL